MKVFISVVVGIIIGFVVGAVVGGLLGIEFMADEIARRDTRKEDQHD